MKLHQWEADTIKMGYYAIDIATPDNDEEFYLGKSQFSKRHPEERTFKAVTESRSTPTSASSTNSTDGTASRLSKNLQTALRQTAEEFALLPILIRPIVKEGIKSRTGQSIEGWIEDAQFLSSRLEAAADQGRSGQTEAPPMDAALDRLAGYFHEAPDQSLRFVKDDKERAAVVAKMTEREATVRTLIQALRQG